MDMDADSTSAIPVFSTEPDPNRASVPAAVAAKYFQKSRYYVTELIKHGDIEGYGIQKERDGRIRWFVYEDAIPYESESYEDEPSISWKKLFLNVLDARDLSRYGREAQTRAAELSLETIDVMSEAVQAALNGEVAVMTRLLRDALTKQTEAERQQLKVREFEMKAEACLDKAFREIAPIPDNSGMHIRAGASLSDHGLTA